MFAEGFIYLQFLARQGIAIRGDSDKADSKIIQLLKPCDRDDPELKPGCSAKQIRMYLTIYKMNCSKLWPLQYLRK